MKSTRVGSFIVGLMSLSIAGVAGATLYDATSEFSTTNNPTGVWSYGWMPTDYSAFNLYLDKRIEAVVLGGSTVWYDSAVGTEPNVWRNDGPSSYFDVLPGQFDLHPGSGGLPSVLRFTAPNAGTAQISWEFFAGDFGSMSVGVRNSSGFLWTGVNAGSSSLTNYALSNNEALDFLVYGGYYGGNTPLAATVDFTAQQEQGGPGIPEPATLALMSLGLAGLGFMRRRA